MVEEHNFNMSEIENMIPWERLVFQSLIIKHMKDKETLRKSK
jgi:hypothetical protein